jgi:hypothetical protein
VGAYFWYKRRKHVRGFVYEKLERGFELFVPVLRSSARPMTHPWYTREFLTEQVNCDMENGLQVDAIYTDFFKKYDKVSHRLLLRKLAKLGFSDSFLA